MKILTILIIILFVFHFESKGQVKRFYTGFGLEFGIGYNTATTKFVDYYYHHKNDATFYRNSLWFKPTIRINYEFKLFKLGENNTIKLKPFIGYYTFGGKSGRESNGYKDIYKFRSLEIGVIPTLNIKEKLQMGVAFKGQYIIDAIGKFYGYLLQSDTIPRMWQEVNVNDDFNTYAISLGFNIRYKLRQFTISGESWYGLSNLSSINWAPGGKQRITENNFRILISYDL